jgi:hypothetical protein
VATYRTLEGYPKSKWHRGDFYAETKLKCAWADRLAVVAAIDATPSYPYSDGPSTALAYESNTEPFGAQLNSNTPLASYAHALITVKYTTAGPMYVFNHGSMTEEYGPFTVYQRLDGNKLFWYDTQPCGTAAGGKIYYGQEWRVTWHNLVSPTPVYMTAVLANSLAGCTNSNTVLAFTSSRTFAPETLLFTPPVVTTTYSIGYTPKTTVKLSLKYWPYGWNTFWRAETQQFEVYYADGQRTRTYPLAQFPSR